MDRKLDEISTAPGPLVFQLLEAGKIDTVYRDIYFDRARTILSQFLPHSEYLDQRRRNGEIDDLVRQIASALERQEWTKVKELTRTVNALQQALEEKRVFSELAKEIYEPIDVPFNPFDPALRAVWDNLKQDPAQLRHQLVRSLTDFEKADPVLRDFYAPRRVFFQSLILPAKFGNETENADPVQIQKQARSALQKRDISSLERLADEMLKPRVVQGELRWAEAVGLGFVTSDQPHFVFAEKTVSAARRLGLTVAHTESSQEFGDYLQCCCAWHPKIPERPLTEGGACIEGCTCGHICPPGIPEPLKETLDLLMLHVFINSAGVRYLPRFIPEQVLVENFPEEENYSSGSELLSALGLERRSGLCRLQIEQSLLLKGPQLVENELGLSSREFRLVCIPFDLYSRLAPSHGWGQKKNWTHFDGFQIWKGGRLRALVGGDVQFGGKYDLCSISRVDENVRTIARFAVVRRERLDVNQRWY